MKSNLIKFFKNLIEQNSNKSFVNISTLLMNIIMLGTYLKMEPIIADYTGNVKIFYFAKVCFIIFILNILFEIICIIGYTNIEDFLKKIKNLKNTKIRFKISIKDKILRLMLPAFLIMLFCIFYHTTDYYLEVSEVFGIPVGIGNALSRSEIKDTAECWKLQEYKVINLIVLEHIDAYKHPHFLEDYSSYYAYKIFDYPEKVKIHYKKSRKKFREECNQEQYASAINNSFRFPYTIKYCKKDNTVFTMKLDNNRYDLKDQSNLESSPLLNSTLLNSINNKTQINILPIKSLEISYHTSGLTNVRKTFPSYYNSNGICGEKYSYDNNNRMTELCFLDENGNPACDKTGIMKILFSYEENFPRPSSIKFYSDEKCENPTEGFEGAAVEKLKYDASGNLCQIEFFDANGNWWHDKNNVFKYKYEFDDGKLISEHFYNFDDSLAFNNKVMGYAIQFLSKNVKDELMLSIKLDSGCANTVANNDIGIIVVNQAMTKEYRNVNMGNVANNENDNNDLFGDESSTKEITAGNTEDNFNNISAFGENSEDTYNYAAIDLEIDKFGNIKKEKYLDSSGKLAINNQGYSIKCYTYYKNSNLVETVTYYSSEDSKCVITDGYAGVKKTYNSDGSIKSEQYLDADDNIAINIKLGYAKVDYTYEQIDGTKIVLKTYWGKEDEIVYLEKGYAKIEQIFDERGLLLQESYFDEAKSPVNRTDYQVASIIYEYADNGNLIRELYKSIDGNTINRIDTGFAVVYRTYNLGKLMEIRYSGYNGKNLEIVPNKKTGAAIIRYTYDKGQITRLDYYDSSEMSILLKDTGYASHEIFYNNKGQIDEEIFYGADGNPVIRKDTGYAIIRFKYNENGKEASEFYYGTMGEPVISSKYRCAGFLYGYDENGNNDEIRSIDIDGNAVIRDDRGYAIIRREYDAAGKKRTETYFDEHDKPTLVKNGCYHKCEYNYTKYYDEERYLGLNGEPKLRNDKGYAVFRSYKNEYGKCSKERYFSKDEKLIIGLDNKCAGIDYNYTDYGKVKEKAYIDETNRPFVRKDLGFAIVIYDYDKYGNLIREEFFDHNRNPIISDKYGYSKYEASYRNKNWIEGKYYDEYGDLVLINDTGAAIVKNEYNNQGLRIKSEYYGVDEKPVTSKKYHCAGFVYEYDSRGNTVCVKYMDENGKINIRNDLGFAHVDKKYDKYDQLIGENYYGIKDEPIACVNGGYASYLYSYDNGNWIGGSYYDVEGNLMNRADIGYAKIINVYNGNNNRISELYFDKDDKPVYHTKFHCAGLRKSYDEFGNIIRTEYLNCNKYPMIRYDLGYATEIKQYDKYGNTIRVSYYDNNGNAVTNAKGKYHRAEYKYINKKCIESRFYSVDNKLTSKIDEGFAISKNEYDDLGNLISTKFYGTDEKPIFSGYHQCAGYEYSYDKDALQKIVYYIGLDDGNSRANRNTYGYAKCVIQYDYDNNIISESYYDLDGNPVVDQKGGYASYENKLENGKIVEQSYYDTDGNSVLRKDNGYAKIIRTYDERGCLANEAFLGIEGNPIVNVYGYAGVAYEYDINCNKIKTTFIGLNKKPIIRNDLGYAKEELIHDERGNIRIRKYLDTGDSLIACSDGMVALENKEYNNNDQCIKQTFFDISDNPAYNSQHDSFGVCYMYDNIGNIILKQHLDADGNIINSNINGISQFKYTYSTNGKYTQYLDENGNDSTWIPGGFSSFEEIYENGLIAEIRYFDKEGNLVNRLDSGYAKKIMKYNELNQCIYEFYFDSNNNPAVINGDNYSGYKYEYDDYGNCVYTISCDTNGNYIESNKTGASLNYKVYNDDGDIEFDGYYKYLDSDWILVNRKDTGYAYKRSSYDNHRIVEELYYNDIGIPTKNSSLGYAKLTKIYKDNGLLETEKFFDENGLPVQNK